jgi:hypothetical protein
VTAPPVSRIVSRLVVELREAVNQSKLAYQFAPNSYTASALSACLAAQETLELLCDHLEDPQGSGFAGLSAATSNALAAFGFPVTALRLNVVSGSSSGSVLYSSGVNDAQQEIPERQEAHFGRGCAHHPVVCFIRLGCRKRHPGDTLVLQLV